MVSVGLLRQSVATIIALLPLVTRPTVGVSSTTEADPTTSPSPSPSPSPTTIAEVPTTMLTTTEIEINSTFVEPILNSTTDPLQALRLVRKVTASGEQPIIAIYLLGVILSRMNTNIQSFSNDFIRAGSTIIEQRTKADNPAIAGSSLLSTFDQFAVQVFPRNGNISFGNIVLKSQQLSPEGDPSSQITTINSADFNNTLPEMSLQIPLDLVQISANKSGNASERVRAISFLFYNVENLFPSDLPGRNQSNKSELASGIVSTTLLVGGQIIPTDENITLSSPIRVLIEHTDAVRERLLKDDASETVCVFWEFLSIINSRDDSTLTRGQWSDRGCSTFFNSSVTMCECSHLTHFAILLSPRPLNLSPPVKLSLQIIGYVGVSVSLVAMALTIITFLVLKPLRNMRNLIHVNLCISLGIAQLIFVIGVSRSDPTSQTVPVHCQIIAVLLHYFFLVSFMWMLMEGAVLYIILVKVFITNEKYYMLAFIFISYGVPALYMGLLTLPLGFALPLQPNYGYRKACFLNPDTNFMWAFIVPVIIIIFINIGFFIMAAVIMWHHKKKRNQSGEMNESDIRKWMIALVTLVVIMGLTWVFGILIVAVNALIPLAYIYTIMVAFQGLFIFLLFVVFPKQVRDEYKEWWKAKVKTLPKNSACTSLTKQNGTATTDATSETSTNLSVSSNGPRQGKNLQSKDEKQGKNLQSKDKNNEVILTLMVGSLHEHPQAHINLTSEESQN